MMLDSKQRGLSDQQISAIKCDEKMMELLRHPRLFLGIRNGYFNLYFQGASAGKCSILSTGDLKIETHCKYLGTGGSGYQTISQVDFPSRLDKILSSIQDHQETGKGWDEKKAQQALLMANNQNTDSVWYCVDMEYTQERQSSDEPYYGRFDIVALSRDPDAKGQHQAALVELKVDSGSYGSKLPKGVQRQIKDGTFSIDRCEVGLGSGIIGHLADFYRFERAGQFSQLREEICLILSTKHKLGFSVPCAGIRPDEIAEQPSFYFLTLCTNISSCKETMCRYLGADGYMRLATYNARRVLGSTFLDRENYRFLFAPKKFYEVPPVDILEDSCVEELCHRKETYTSEHSKRFS